MLIVKGEGKKIEWILKEYRRKVDKSQQLKHLRDLREFEQPSIARRQEKQRAKYRAQNADR
jgi:ribosomal protein S21